MGGEGNKRLYVGNLFTGVTEQDITKRFSKFGDVAKVEIKSKRDIDGEVTETFAFIDLATSQEGLANCISSLSNTKWKGKVLKLQQAKESFMDRLARERKEREAKEAQDDSPAPVPVTKESSNDEPMVKKLNKKRSFPEERDFTEEQEDFKGFFKGEDGGSGAGNKYDPMSIFKAKVAGDEVPAAEASENLNMDDVGEIKDGLVVFGEDTEAEKGLFNVGKMKVNKVYHSSSEDEEEKEEKTKAVKPKKKTKAAEDKKSAEFKEKMTKRFLQKQKESEELEVQKVAAKEKAKARKKAVNKYYSDSDDESEGETKAADDDESEGENKVGTEVLEKLETFAGDVWRDSDEEQDNAEDAVKYNPMSIFQAKLREGGDEVVAAEDGTGVVTSSDEEESDEEESDEEEKVKDVKDEKVKEVEEDESDEDDEEDDEEEEEEKEAEVAKVEDKVEFGTSTMVRYDPTSEEQDKFLRTDPEDTAGIEKTGDKASKGFFNVTTDLKKAFTSAKASSDGGGGFSFGFSKEPEKAAVEVKSMEVDDDDYNEGDGEEVVKKTDDAVASFGLQLRGKGVASSKEPFFFVPDDPRLEVGLDFFFNHEVDLDKLREKWDQERPVLAEILKKRARLSKAKKVAGVKRKGAQAGGWRRGAKRRKHQ